MGSTHVIVWKRQTDLWLKQVTNLKNNLNIHMKSTQKKSCICKSQITKKQKTNGAKDYRRGGGKSAKQTAKQEHPSSIL